MHAPATPVRKKLIEVSIPLEAINKASAREKSIRHGHPSTLHLWWARRPLAACRAVLFAQLVDDPSAWPDRFPTEEEREAERRRLHKVIERLVPWEASNDEAILNEARWEIARSVAWGLGEEPPPKGDGKAILAFLQEKAPPVYDPFSGGGSIPLEAQRLGLRAYGSDLNPVAVLIGKALVEIPPNFAGMPPVNPEAQEKLKRNGGVWTGKGAEGLAEDVRYYGKWMRDEAETRIGHLYPKAKLSDGSEATVIAWIWARTVRSPDPAAKGAMVPLVSSFLLSSKGERHAWVEPILDREAPHGYRFAVQAGKLKHSEEQRVKTGTKLGRGSSFACLLTGSPIESDYIKSEGIAGRISERLMAIVIEKNRGRAYIDPVTEHEEAAFAVKPSWRPPGTLPQDPRNFWTTRYGLDTYSSLFTARQVNMLSTYADLIPVVQTQIAKDAAASAIRRAVPVRTSADYERAIATYLGLAVSKLADAQSSLARWKPSMDQAIATFARQSLPMVWDFAESNAFSGMAGDYNVTINNISKVIDNSLNTGLGIITNTSATKNSFCDHPAVFSTDPPYYDNIGYADLSDYFYVWLKKSLGSVWPDLFRRLSAPKDEELVANPYRHDGRIRAERFFMSGMLGVLSAMEKACRTEEPIAIYYAFKQSEVGAEGLTSPGWASFLQAVLDSKIAVDGTWPMRTELANRMIGRDANALASSVVLVCRKRPDTADVITRAEFIRALKSEMPDAIDKIRKAGVGPVDMQQSVIGPGMAVFSRYAKVLEDDDSAMMVKTALSLINRVWGEIENELDQIFDPETQVALAWFATYGFDARPSGDLIGLATAKDTAIDALFASGVFTNLRGKACLTPRDELPKDWTPATDKHLTVWECVQHTARVLDAEDGGADAAAALVAQMGPKAAEARALAYRLFEIATQKGWAAEALVYNALAEEWPKLEDRAAEIGAGAGGRTAAPTGPAQGVLL